MGYLAQPTTLMGISRSLEALCCLNGIHLRIVEGEGNDSSSLIVTHEYQPPVEVEETRSCTLRYFGKEGNFNLLQNKPGLFVSPVLTYQDLEDFEKSRHAKVGIGFTPAVKRGTLDAGAGLKEKREVHRTTLSGDVELKTESEVSSLNRDLSKAREVTKKSKTHVRVFTPFGTVASMKELFKDMDQQFARIPAYFKPNTVEHYQTQALMEQLKAYQKEQLDNKEIQERLQDEQTLAEIAQRGNHAFVENYFTRRGRAIDKEAEMGLSQGLTPYFEKGEDGERILLFAQPQHVTLEADKHGKPHLVVQLGERPELKPAPKDNIAGPSISNAPSAQKKPAQSTSAAAKRNPTTTPFSEAEKEKLATFVVGKLNELLVQQGCVIQETLLKKIVLEQLSNCRSERDLITLGKRLKEKNIQFNGYMIEEQMRLAQSSSSSAYQSVCVQALPLLYTGACALAFFICDRYRNQQSRTGGSSGRYVEPEDMEELLGGRFERPPMRESGLGSNVETFPAISQEPNIMGTPIPDQQPSTTEFPAVESSSRDSIYAGTSSSPAPLLYMFKKPQEENLRPHAPNPDHAYHPTPKHLPGFPDAARVRKSTDGPRWELPSGKILELDKRHGELEMYDKRGNHLGAFDINSGEKIKEKVSGRKMDR